MLRLSQRAWNNVVILAMLFMVYLFTLSNDMINEGEQPSNEVIPVFPAYSVIMSLDFGFVRLERIGQDWRVKGAEDIAINSLVPLSEQWSMLEVQRTNVAPEQAPYIVSVLLAGEDKKRVFQLYSVANGTLLQSDGRFYLAQDVATDKLFPVDRIPAL
ncbi:hypothetical protein [Planctobacterium marinum]|uniref:hypothetical protein n=1 Tax=Planctobacterium marinum TaxID=1631968 RepID=UPI001E44BE94|nr:hypothetical protein [Planctobacterium marinum]MCC2606423.1 hypothetical protein [Planctobacterium marinum]